MASTRFLVSLVIPAVLGFSLAACSKQEDTNHSVTQSDGQVAVSIVTYMESEAGIDPYPLRILVSSNFVRLDDGYDASDYVLLDRKSRTLSSVTHETRSILVIENQRSDATLPDSITLTDEQTTDPEAPLIDSRQPVQTRYMANGTTCFEAVSVDGIMTEAVSGMKDFAIALGERQLANLHTVPASMKTPCFLSRYAYSPGRLYQQGLPVQLWDETGFYRSLTDFDDKGQATAELFTLPDNYQETSL